MNCLEQYFDCSLSNVVCSHTECTRLQLPDDGCTHQSEWFVKFSPSNHWKYVFGCCTARIVPFKLLIVCELCQCNKRSLVPGVQCSRDQYLDSRFEQGGLRVSSMGATKSYMHTTRNAHMFVQSNILIPNPEHNVKSNARNRMKTVTSGKRMSTKE